MRRAEPVAGIFNAMLVLGATVEIVREGIAELNGGGEPRAGIMLVVAVAALVRERGKRLAAPRCTPRSRSRPRPRPRQAWLDESVTAIRSTCAAPGCTFSGDALGSVAALVAAIVDQARRAGNVSTPSRASRSPRSSSFSAFRVVRDATLVLLEAAPLHVPVGAVREVIRGFAGIAEVHDLHVWTLGAGHDAITAHVRAKAHDPTIARRLSLALREAFETEYVTVQVESPEEECAFRRR